MELAMTALFAAVALLWLGLTGLSLLCLRRLKRLPPLRPDAPDRARSDPRVSIVIAARDEEARIETTVRRLLGQRAVDLELIVVDDRSSDRTGALLDALAAEDPRLRVVHLAELPPDWLGKCHACHVGGGRATAGWILFTDADVWMRPDVVARAVEAAERAGAAHVTLMPGLGKTTIPTRATILAGQIAFMPQIAAVNLDIPGASVGVGAFNLVRADAYRAIGGHESLRLEVIDDLKLAMLCRRAGGRSRVFLAGQDVEVDWAADVGGMVRALRKNGFALMNFSLVELAGAVLAGFGVWLVAVVGPFTGQAAGLAAGLALLTLAGPAAELSRRYGWGPLAGLITPLLFPLLLLPVVNSTFVTLREGGVRWRDTFYPLKTLREGLIR